MKKIILEKEKCINCSSCTSVCPKYFEAEEDGKARLKNSKEEDGNEVIELEDVDCCQEAAEVCPVQCILITED